MVEHARAHAASGIAPGDAAAEEVLALQDAGRARKYDGDVNGHGDASGRRYDVGPFEAFDETEPDRAPPPPPSPPGSVPPSSEDAPSSDAVDAAVDRLMDRAKTAETARASSRALPAPRARRRSPGHRCEEGFEDGYAHGVAGGNPARRRSSPTA